LQAAIFKKGSFQFERNLKKKKMPYFAGYKSAEGTKTSNIGIKLV